MNSDKLKYAVVCLFAGWVMMFAYAQGSSIFSKHSFIFLREETPYTSVFGLTEEDLQPSGFLNVGNIDKALTRKIAGNIRHSDAVLVALLVLEIISGYIFIFALGQLDTRNRD